ncbi:CYTH and CHAD domain-containing protein [uncultured Piscinibacter sp.]|uniref:CYTH and CHAD domain-containing protein n=1 Tax=uncultured Piscinibacter sp. TaxID=1131835 RepID=UPI0026168D21|nr:CYTH and CHAD domain-containing protein [uncultured Piscinibacter sp.]
MTEIELKFQVPRERREAVAAAVAGRAGAASVQRLQAVYFDTAGGELAAAGVALRVRREGPRWVQTLKAASDDAMTRLEHNVERAGRASEPPLPDPALHEGTAAGARLAAALAGVPDAALQCQYRTDIRRTARQLRVRGATLELAFDRGCIIAGERRLPVCELEIELLRGSAAALLGTARQWVARHGLWLDTRSKAERGTLLAAGQPRSPARKAATVELRADMGVSAARRCVLGECLQQVSVNASQVAGGDFGDEHVHQLRVGLRRLRTALRLFDVAGEAVALSEASAALFGALGAARDLAAVGAPLRERLGQAMSAAGVALAAPALPLGGAAEPAESMRAAAAQALLLDLIAATLPGDAAEAEAPAAEALARRLRRWHRGVARDAANFAALDDEGKHRLRKHVKRLRYAVEFTQCLLGAKKVSRYLRALAALQERLGALNDVMVAIDAFREPAAHDPAAGFALGWLAARREALIADCTPAIERLARTRRPWKG